MTLTLGLLFLIVGAILFLLAALNVPSSRFSLVAGGLFFVTLALIFGR